MPMCEKGDSDIKERKFSTVTSAPPTNEGNRQHAFSTQRPHLVVSRVEKRVTETARSQHISSVQHGETISKDAIRVISAKCRHGNETEESMR